MLMDKYINKTLSLKSQNRKVLGSSSVAIFQTLRKTHLDDRNLKLIETRTKFNNDTSFCLTAWLLPIRFNFDLSTCGKSIQL